MNKEQELQKALQAAQDALANYQSKPAVWVPREGGEYYWRVISEGEVVTCPRVSEFDERSIKRGNCYQTKELALKASEYSKVQGLINQVCLNVEGDYVPDWNDKWETKHIATFHPSLGKRGEWMPLPSLRFDFNSIPQSSTQLCQQVCDILNDINLKPVGVKATTEKLEVDCTDYYSEGECNDMLLHQTRENNK